MRPKPSWVDIFAVVVSGSPATVNETAGQATAGVTNTRKLGSLQVTKTVNWNGVTPDTAQTFQICIQGPSYPSSDCKLLPEADATPWTADWANLIYGMVGLILAPPAVGWLLGLTIGAYFVQLILERMPATLELAGKSSATFSIARSAAATILRASRAFMARGFSHMTWTPAERALMEQSAWR